MDRVLPKALGMCASLVSTMPILLGGYGCIDVDWDAWLWEDMWLPNLGSNWDVQGL